MKFLEISNQQQVDEGLKDYLGYVKNKIVGLVSSRHAGKAEIQELVNNSMQNFGRWMGRRGEELKNVTWKTFFNFMVSRQGLGFTTQDANKMLNNSKIREQVKNDWAKLGKGYLPPDDDWDEEGIDLDAPIGGHGNNRSSAKYAKLAVSYILWMSALHYLDTGQLPRKKGRKKLGPTDKIDPWSGDLITSTSKGRDYDSDEGNINWDNVRKPRSAAKKPPSSKSSTPPNFKPAPDASEKSPKMDMKTAMLIKNHLAKLKNTIEKMLQEAKERKEPTFGKIPSAKEVPFKTNIDQLDKKAAEVFQSDGIDGFVKFWEDQVNTFIQKNIISTIKDALEKDQTSRVFRFVKLISANDDSTKRIVTNLITGSKLSNKSKNNLMALLSGADKPADDTTKSSGEKKPAEPTSDSNIVDKQNVLTKTFKDLLAKNDINGTAQLIRNISKEIIDKNLAKRLLGQVYQSKLQPNQKEGMYKLLSSKDIKYSEETLAAMKGKILTVFKKYFENPRSSGLAKEASIAAANLILPFIDKTERDEIIQKISKSQILDNQKKDLIQIIKTGSLNESAIIWLSESEFKKLSSLLLEAGLSWPMFGYKTAIKNTKTRKIGLIETASGGSTSAGSVASVATPMGAMIRRMPAGQSFFAPYVPKKTKKKAKKK